MIVHLVRWLQQLGVYTNMDIIREHEVSHSSCESIENPFQYASSIINEPRFIDSTHRVDLSVRQTQSIRRPSPIPNSKLWRTMGTVSCLMVLAMGLVVAVILLSMY